MLKIAIIGHRSLKEPQKVRKDIASTLKYFKEKDNDLLAISAIAAGADTLFAEEAAEQKIKLQLMIPFELQEYRKDFNGADLVKFDKITKKKDYKIVQKLTTNDPEERKNAYRNVGRKMVDEADVVLAVWDGEPAEGKGGTGEIVAYAKSKGKELHIIKGIREGNTEENEAEQKFQELDKDAIKYKKHRFEYAWIGGLISGILAVFCFAIGLTFQAYFEHFSKFFLACLEFLFLIISACLLFFLARKWKDIFLEKRRNAEYLRSIIWYNDAGIPIPLIKKTEFEVLDEILAIEKKVAKEITHIQNFPNAKRKAWCLAQEQIAYHKDIRINPFKKKNAYLELSFLGIKIVFFNVVSIKFVLELLEYLALHRSIISMCLEDSLAFPILILNGLLIVLPPIYAALEGYKYFSEWERNIEISEKKVRELKECKNRILQCKDEKVLAREAQNLRQILESENSDWAIRYDEKEIEVKV